MKEWLRHVRSWWYSVCRLPLPWLADYHMWTSVIGEQEQECFTCGATRLDPDFDAEEAARERALWAPIEAMIEDIKEDSE